MFKDLLDLLNPKGGRGMLEAIIAIIIIVALVAMNFLEVEVSKTLEALAYMLFGYLWGNRPRNGDQEEQEAEND